MATLTTATPEPTCVAPPVVKALRAARDVLCGLGRANSTFNTSPPSPPASTASLTVSRHEVSDPSNCSAGLRPHSVLALSTSRADGRSTAALKQLAGEAAARGADVTSVVARDLPLVFPDQDAATFPDAVRRVVDLAKAVDVIAIGMPVFRAEVAGFTRHWVELLRDGVKGTVVVPIVAAGSARSTLVGNTVRADLIVNFDARPTAAIVVSPELEDAELTIRIDDVLASAFASAVAR